MHKVEEKSKICTFIRGSDKFLIEDFIDRDFRKKHIILKVFLRFFFFGGGLFIENESFNIIQNLINKRNETSEIRF